MTFTMFLLQFYSVSLANMFGFLTNYHHCCEWILTQTWVGILTQWQLSDDKWFLQHNDMQHCISCFNMMTKWMNKMWFSLQSYFWLHSTPRLLIGPQHNTSLLIGRCLKHSKPLWHHKTMTISCDDRKSLHKQKIITWDVWPKKRHHLMWRLKWYIVAI